MSRIPRRLKYADMDWLIGKLMLFIMETLAYPKRIHTFVAHEFQNSLKFAFSTNTLNMKVAYHFATKNLQGFYGDQIYQQLFGAMHSFRNVQIDSIVLVGDFIRSNNVKKDEWPRILEIMIHPDGSTWRKFEDKNVAYFLRENVFIVCFESISKKVAEFLDNKLKKYQPYIGAFEIDDSNPVQYNFYSARLPAYFRIINKKLNILSPDDEWLDESWKELFQKLGFEVKREITGLYRSVFDANHNYDSAKKIAEWRKNANHLLTGLTDSIISRLLDTAPELGSKLWSTFNTYEKSETSEQLAQVMTSCRRIFEYVTDCIFPPTDKIINGHSLQKDKYKNRLMQFATESKASNTNIDLIVANTDTLFHQWEKLIALANKGVHGEVYLDETRRCVIRTIMLLDDIISLRDEPFQIQTKLNHEFDKFIDRIVKK